jgi:ParB/RepB/Spo0J family partition protein
MTIIDSSKTTTNEQNRTVTIKSIGRLKDVLRGEENTAVDKIRQYESYVDKIVKIPIAEIQLDENIRKNIDTECNNFKSLLSSIIKHGIQQNIIVEFRNYGDSYNIVCVSGHRRVTAAKLAGTINVVPALIKKFEKDDARTEHALIENLLREDLHCLDIADGYKDLFSKGWSREKLAKSFGKTDRTIHTYLKMAEWSDRARKVIIDNPEIFTAKLLTRKIACRRFSTEAELVDALSSLLKTNTTKTKTPSKKDLLTEELNNYLNKKQFKTEIKFTVLQTFKDLHLIN